MIGYGIYNYNSSDSNNSISENSRHEVRIRVPP